MSFHFYFLYFFWLGLHLAVLKIYPWLWLSPGTLGTTYNVSSLLDFLSSPENEVLFVLLEYIW